MPTLVYPFEAKLSASERMRLLGTKAAGLNEMTALGIPVPPGFTITSEVGRWYRETGRWPDELEDQVERALRSVEERTDRRFGDPTAPLLVSVRSGAAVSMPGMMDSLLNVGLTERTIAGLESQSSHDRFALDSYRRLLYMYGTIVRGIGADRFQQLLVDRKATFGRARMLDYELPFDALDALIADYLALIENESGSPFPQDARLQLWDAIGAVFASWENLRARRYRRMEGIDEAVGTSCTVQAMVFGNTGPRSGSGVAFTRNPSTGDKELYGEFLADAQGEDVVAGIRTPAALTVRQSPPGKEDRSLERLLPGCFEAIADYCRTLETHFGDIQDVEFTVQDGAPFLLQTRRAKRTARAAVRAAVEMVHEGVLERDEALLRVDPRSLGQLIQAKLRDPTELAAAGIFPIAVGLPASPGAASGRVVFDADDAVRWAAEGQDVILVRQETSAEDIHGMKVAKGVVTAAGGMTSHAAVVARGLGKCCVVGCGALEVDYRARQLRARGTDDEAKAIEEGELLSIDGSTGKIYAGVLDVIASPTVTEFEELMEWADDARRIRVYADADTPQSARAALSYGAEGVGLCRTEHLFFAPERLLAMRCVLLAEDAEQRAEWLGRIERAQRDDFAQILDAMQGRPVTIRLLDRAMQEFLRLEERDVEAIAAALDLDADDVHFRVRQRREGNPAFGHRGVRAGLTVLGLYDMQLRAMLWAARDCAHRGTPVDLEVSVPMVAYPSELEAMRAALERVRSEIFDRASDLVDVRLAAMVELPRACLVADQLARHADVFAFGANDLTQTALGISRDDAGRFLPTYLNDLELVHIDPFAQLDETGVGELIELGLKRARKARPALIAGLCGEQAADPAAIAFCERLGLDFVSCQLQALPGARLAAAQARLRASK